MTEKELVYMEQNKKSPKQMQECDFIEKLAQLENDGKWVEATKLAHAHGWIPDEDLEEQLLWSKQAEQEEA